MSELLGRRPYERALQQPLSSPIVTVQSLWLEIGRDHRWSGGRRKAIGPRKVIGIMCSRCTYALAVRSWMVTPEKAHGDEINRQQAQSGTDPDRRVEIFRNGNDRKQRPNDECRSRNPAQMADTHRMDDMKRHEGQRGQRSNGRRADPRVGF